MAQQRAADRNGASIARAGKRKWGYDVGQVDSFLERAHTLYEDAEPKMTQEDIQNVSFALEKDGYVISQVDAALNRLEKAVVDKQTQWDVNTTGRVAWRATTEQLAHSLYPRAKRPAKERFAPGADKRPSYDRKQVDRLVDQLVEKIRHELGETRQHQSDVAARAEAELTSVKVSNVIFTQRKGKRGYSERQVDAYLNRAVQVLSRLESFARLEGSLHLDDMEPLDAEPQASQASQSQPTQALFGAVPSAKADVRAGQEGYGYAVPPAPAAESAPAAAQSVAEKPTKDDARSERDASFYDLRQAESALVNSTTDSTPAADTPAAAVSGSLAGLVNGTSAVAPTDPVSSSNDMPTTAIPPLPDALPAQEPSFPLVDSTFPSYEPTSHAFDFGADDKVDAQAPKESVSKETGIANSVAGRPAPRHSAEPSIWSSASSRTTADASAFETATNDDVVPAGTGDSDGGHASDSPFSGDEAGDYFSSLLDTSSIPSVDFHIPSLTFPSADDKDGKDDSGSGKY
ncbi:MULTISPECIES: DivIVA domain-containing protein [Bifidobacterium]|uniref:DivIVA domain-containing protein n=1 Tax=Bifidobacterium TaxID=1678 RepID=UPI001953964E|nr:MULTISPECIES: DivIVA domain-containing protein [Bifidobacterium]